MTRKISKIVLTSTLTASLFLGFISAANADVVLQRNLEKGIRGDDVLQVQQLLKDLGYFKVNPTGYYGSITEASVKKFQKAYKVQQTGVVGPTTLGVLNRVAAAKGVSRSSQESTREERIVHVVKKGDTVYLLSLKYGVSMNEILVANQLSETSILHIGQKLVIPTQRGLSASRGQTANFKYGEYLDWWSEARYIFPIGSVATVTDFRTGRQFQIKRTYGSNHADIETLTVKDSAIVKEIWGGWTWITRPVIVEVNGRRIAASMSAMPHAGLDSAPANAVVNGRSGNYGRGTNLDTVKGNGIDGHMDLHFLNSRTHNTNKVNPLHQASVKEAAGR